MPYPVAGTGILKQIQRKFERSLAGLCSQSFSWVETEQVFKLTEALFPNHWMSPTALPHGCLLFVR